MSESPTSASLADSFAPLLVTPKSAAELLGISARRLWDLTKRRAVPSRKIGRSVRYHPAELQAWIDAECPTEPGSADRVRKGVRR